MPGTLEESMSLAERIGLEAHSGSVVELVMYHTFARMDDKGVTHISLSARCPEQNGSTLGATRCSGFFRRSDNNSIVLASYLPAVSCPSQGERAGDIVVDVQAVGAYSIH